jgi:hypothetical protein
VGDRRGTSTVYDGIRYKSAFEASIARDLTERGVAFEYEDPDSKLFYTTSHVYTPDFSFGDGLVVEAKGYFPPQDRTKMLNAKEANGEFDIRLLFQNPKTRLSSASKTTYAQWAERHGFVWASSKVPDEWIKGRR